MPEAIYLNGAGAEALGLRLVDGGPALDGVQRTRDAQPWPMRAGVIESPFSTSEPRTLRFSFHARSVTTLAQRTAALDALSDRLTGPVEVRFEDGTTRIVRGMCRVYQASIQSPTFVNIAPTIIVEIACANAARYDAIPTLLVLGTTPAPIPVGTVAHGGQITVTGPTTTPFTIGYRNVGGTLIDQISITPALATGEYLLIDLDTHDLVKVGTTGTRTRVKTWDTSPGTWFSITPRDCARDMNAFPTLESSVAAAYYFRRNWEN